MRRPTIRGRARVLAHHAAVPWPVHPGAIRLRWRSPSRTAPCSHPCSTRPRWHFSSRGCSSRRGAGNDCNRCSPASRYRCTSPHAASSRSSARIIRTSPSREERAGAKAAIHFVTCSCILTLHRASPASPPTRSSSTHLHAGKGSRYAIRERFFLWPLVAESTLIRPGGFPGGRQAARGLRQRLPPVRTPRNSVVTTVVSPLVAHAALRGHGSLAPRLNAPVRAKPNNSPDVVRAPRPVRHKGKPIPRRHMKEENSAALAVGCDTQWSGAGVSPARRRSGRAARGLVSW